MTEKQLCRDCIHLEHDGFAGIWCGVHGNNKNYDCPKYEKKGERMTEKRFTIVNMGLDGRFIKEDGKIMEIDRVIDLLNENEQLKEQNRQLRLENGRLTHDLFWANKKIKEELE